MRMDPHLFDFTRRQWRWHLLPEDVAQFLAQHAAADELVTVKSTDCRAVYRFDKYFIKVCGSYQLKSFLTPSAREEYNAYCQLTAAGIGAVKHLGWGRCGHYTALVTEVWQEDAVDALNYWYSQLYNLQDTDEFICDLTGYLHDLVNSTLQHGDFHLGNILYSPSQRKFTLVDLHHVSAGTEHTLGEKARMLQILTELRSGLRPQRMLELFWEAGHIDNNTAAAAIRSKLITDAERTRHSWKRRVKQFLTGYAKFSDFITFNGQVLLVQRNKLRRNLFDPAGDWQEHYRTVRLEFPAALEQMLFSFYLSLLQVPHIPVAALAPDGTLYYPRSAAFDEIPTDREWVNSFNEYLLCMGLNNEDYSQWRHHQNQQLLLADFSSMLAAMPNRALFQVPDVNPRRWRIRKHH